MNAMKPLGNPAVDSRLLTYADLCIALGGEGHAISLRQVKRVVSRFKFIAKPIRYGYRTVRFRPANIEKLKSHLSGEDATPATSTARYVAEMLA